MAVSSGLGPILAVTICVLGTVLGLLCSVTICVSGGLEQPTSWSSLCSSRLCFRVPLRLWENKQVIGWGRNSSFQSIVNGMGILEQTTCKKLFCWLAREPRQVGEVPGVLTQYGGPREWGV